jgi:hypothetical protein
MVANATGSSNGQSNPDDPGRSMFDKDRALSILGLSFEMESAGGSIAPEAEADSEETQGSTEP